jgi:glutaredoxin 3
MRVRALLERRGIEYTEVSVEDHPELRTELLARSGRRTLPQVYIGERYVGGADELTALDQNGELLRLTKSEE